MRTYTLTDGETRVSLITASNPGIMAVRGGLGPTNYNPEATFNEISGEDGAYLVGYRHNPVIENWRLNILGTSQDDAARQLQGLFMLLRKAVQFHLTRWQTDPVWLQAQTTEETNTRYSLVFGPINWQVPDLFKVPFETDAEIAEMSISITREPFWRSLPPGTLPTALQLSAPDAPSPQATTRRQFVSNYRHTNVLTHIFNYDDSLTAFSANFIAADPWTLFEVSGSTPAVGDIIYLGSTSGPWFNAVFNLTQVIAASGHVFTLEYWNGSAWTTATNASLQSLGSALGPFGTRMLKWGGASDWTTTSINSVSAYWFRIRISALTSWTTSPIQGGQVVYAPKNNYVEFDENRIGGDVHALAMIGFSNHTQTDNLIGLIVLGLKTRGLDNFISHINAGGQNPANWTVTPGTDTTIVADPSSPGGNRAACTFAGSVSLATRLTMNYSTVNEKDFEGTYRIFLRCQQITGNVGDVSVRLILQHSAQYVGETVKLIQKDDGVTVVDMGLFEIMPAGRNENEADTALGLIFYIQASAASSTPDIYIYDLVLIPVDEWSATIAQTGLGNSYLTSAHSIQFDSGLQRQGAVKFNGPPSTNTPTVQWETRGEPPTLPPRRKGRIYALMISQETNKFEGPNDLAGALDVYTHQRWIALRGAD